jgi:hypothetical protein
MVDPDRILARRDCTAMAAPDTIHAIAQRVRNLVSHGRRITTVRRYTYIDRPPDVTAGLTVEGVKEWKQHDAAGIAVYLKPGPTAGFGIAAYSSDGATEADVWARYHRDSSDRRDMTEVRIVGGLPGNSPARDDQLVIRHWNQHRVCEETVVAFDCGWD